MPEYEVAIGVRIIGDSEQDALEKLSRQVRSPAGSRTSPKWTTMSDGYIANDGRFPDGADVMVRYPAPGMAPAVPREDWPWMPGVIEGQGAPDEWTVTVYDPALAHLEDGTPAPAGTPGEDQWYPQCFRGPSELRLLNHEEGAG